MLLELVIASSILLVLASAALPVFRYTVVRHKEFELRRDLREMRDAIDRYKDYSDRGLIRVEAGSEGYPPDLGTLIKGVNVGAGAEQKIRFLRRIPKDPMTGRAEWDLRAVQDDQEQVDRCVRARHVQRAFGCFEAEARRGAELERRRRHPALRRDSEDQPAVLAGEREASAHLRFLRIRSRATRYPPAPARSHCATRVTVAVLAPTRSEISR